MIILKNDKLSVQISEIGAEVKSIKTADEVEYIWQGGGEFWEGTSPNLFPIIGRLRDGYYTLDGKRYDMDIHGFAWTSQFECIEQTKTSAVFQLTSSENTLKCYPYKFLYRVYYTLSGDKLTVTYYVENTDDKKIYFSLGAHPGFNVPLAKGGYFDQYFLEFDKEHTPVAYVLDADGAFLTGEKEKFSLFMDKALPLAGQEIFVNTVLLEQMDKAITLKSNKTRRQVRVDYADFDYLALWHDDKSPFICIEPWSGLPDFVGVSREITQKVAMSTLEAGETTKKTYSITIK